MRLQDTTFDLDKARVDAAYVGNICLTYEEWPETDNDMQYILAAVYDLEPALDEIERQAARIKELEAVISEAFQELVTAGPDIGDIAAMSISLAVRKLASQNKRIDAAFLEATKEIVYATHEGRDAPEGEDVYAEKVAREALERIKAGGKDEA